MDYNDYHSFKEITDNPIILDFSKCKYLGEIHLMLKEKFGLPEYRGLHPHAGDQFAAGGGHW